jgi:hypothetical protein
MDFYLTDELAQHRGAACHWVAANVPPEWVDEQYWSGTHQTMDLHRRLARDGILGAGWIGGVDDGWHVMRVALVYEWGAASPVLSRRTLAKDLAGWAVKPPARTGP